MKKTTHNYLLKLSLILFVFTIIGCSVNRDFRHKYITTTTRLALFDLTLNNHFKNGNYILSINDSVGNTLTERFINLQDSSVFKNDTIDLELTHVYWTKTPIARALSRSVEMNDVAIYSISESKYLYKIKRTVSKSKLNDIHSHYIFTNKINGDTILQSHSFDTGTPPF